MKRQRWEYKLLQYNGNPREGALNRMGQDGWEAVGRFDGRMLFKRPVVEECKEEGADDAVEGLSLSNLSAAVDRIWQIRAFRMRAHSEIIPIGDTLSVHVFREEWSYDVAIGVESDAGRVWRGAIKWNETGPNATVPTKDAVLFALHAAYLQEMKRRMSGDVDIHKGDA